MLDLRLIIGVIALVGAFALGGVAGYKIEAGKLAELKLQYAQTEVKAREEAASIQKAQDDVAAGAAVLEATTQAAQAALTEKQIAEVTVHVSPALVLTTGSGGDRPCVSYGLVRVLDAAALGDDPAALQLPAGSSDNSCSPIDAVTLARNIVANYGAARENAEQLNALELTIIHLQEASNVVPK